MLCDLPCPYLGMHQSLAAFACWQRDESCSLSPAPEVGCSSTLPLVPLDLTLPTSSSCPGPCPQAGTLVSLTLWKPPPCQGQGTKWDRAPAKHWGRACPPHRWLVQVHTECGSGFSKNQTCPSKRETCWYVNNNKHCWSGNWTCELNLHFKGTYSCILVLSFDPRY